MRGRDQAMNRTCGSADIHSRLRLKEQPIKTNTVLKLSNPILGILLISQLSTGFLADLLPAGSFGILHKGGAIALAIVSVLHVFLNRNWIKASYFR